MPGRRTEKPDPVETFAILNKGFAMPQFIIGCQVLLENRGIRRCGFGT